MDCRAFFSVDLPALNGETAMMYACRAMEHAPFAPDGTQMGSLAARGREAKREWEIEQTNYSPDRENKVLEDEDIERLIAQGELDEHDVDWS